jgi:hypothetical protein
MICTALSTEAEKRRDAAEFYEADADTLKPEHISALHAPYDQDWREWPVDFGAPFIDHNRNGKYDPPPPFSPHSPHQQRRRGY